jgi:hypothetical protein
MLLVGIDWAETEHAACLVDAGGRLVQRLRVAHTAAGLQRLHGAIAAAEPDAGRVLVALERPEGLLVGSLLGAGYTVYALNPKSVERYRDRARTSGAKTDPADAETLARILLTDRDRHRPLLPSSPAAEEVRAVARDDERAARDQRRLLNRLRIELLEVFPQAVDAFPALEAPTALAFLARWPSVDDAKPVPEGELAAFFRAHRHGWPGRAAAQVRAAGAVCGHAAAPADAGRSEDDAPPAAPRRPGGGGAASGHAPAVPRAPVAGTIRRRRRRGVRGAAVASSAGAEQGIGRQKIRASRRGRKYPSYRGDGCGRR